jgi:hypothetical protein
MKFDRLTSPLESQREISDLNSYITDLCADAFYSSDKLLSTVSFRVAGHARSAFEVESAHIPYKGIGFQRKVLTLKSGRALISE